MYYGDFFTSDVIYQNFTTIGTNGAPTTLSGSPVIKTMKDDGTTQSTAGITLTTDLGSTTGLNNVKIDTSADGTFYASGHEFFIIVTTGTVGGQSIAGYIVGSFSLQNRTGLRPATKGRTALIASGGQIGIDWANVANPTTTVALTGTTVNEATLVETKLGSPAGASVSADIAAIKALLPTALQGGRMDVSVGAYQSGQSPLQPTVAGRTLDVTSTGGAGIDWANVKSPTTTVALSGTTISTSQAIASVSGAVGSVTASVTVGTNNDKTGYALSASGVQAIWDALTSALTTVGSIGKRIVDYLTGDSYVRLGSPAGASVSVDIAAVKSIIGTPAGASIAADLAEIEGETDGIASIPTNPLLTSDSRLNHLDADISSRLATSGYTAPDNADIVTIKAKTDQLAFTSGNVNANAQAVSDKTGYSLQAGQLLIVKNSSLNNFEFPMFDNVNHAPATGLTVTVKRSIDGGTLSSCANSVVEVSGGLYKINLAASDLNGTVITFKASATGADDNIFTVITQP